MEMNDKVFRHPWWKWVGGTLLMAAIGTLTPDAIRAVLLVVAVLGSTLIFHLTGKRTAKHTLVSFVFSAIIGVVLYFGSSVLNARFANTPALYFSCDYTAVPVVLPRGSSTNVVIVPSQLISGQATVMSPTQETKMWLDTQEHSVAVHCRVINDEPTPMLDVQFPLKVVSRAVLRGERLISPSGGAMVTTGGGETTMTGGVLRTDSQTLRIERLAQAGGSYEFYVDNTSDNYVEISPPETATAQVGGQPITVLVRTGPSGYSVLVQPKSTKHP